MRTIGVHFLLKETGFLSFELYILIANGSGFAMKLEKTL